MDVISNNLANVNTVGFKRVRPEFEDLLSERMQAAQAPDPRGGTQPAPLEVGLGVRTTSTTRTFTQGDMLNTGNTLDLAVQGEGFFRVQRPNGDLAYTRAGNLKVDGTGRLTTANGFVLDPEIQVPQNATDITINSLGVITAKVPNQTAPQELGAIELTTFQNDAGLESQGGNLLTATAASGEPQNYKPGENGVGTLAQGYLENSNIQSVQEMVDMISTQRAYELNSKVIQTADQMLQKLTSLR